MADFIAHVHARGRGDNWHKKLALRSVYVFMIRNNGKVIAKYSFSSHLISLTII